MTTGRFPRLAALALFCPSLVLAAGDRLGDGLAADGITLYTTEITPYTIPDARTPGQIAGLFGELVSAALATRQGGLPPGMVRWLPWPRAQYAAEKDRNGVIFPLTQTRDRVAAYRWLAAPIIVRCYIYTTNPVLVPKTLDAARTMRLGALAGSPPAFVVEKNLAAIGGGHFDNDVSEQTNYLKLQADRIDGWVTQSVVARYYDKAGPRLGGVPPRPLVRGVHVFDQALWIAANKNMPDWKADALERQLADFMKTRAFARILKKYGVK